MEFKDYGWSSMFEDAHLSKVRDWPDWLMFELNSWNKNPRGIFTICGSPGLGKTYLCAAMNRDWHDRKLGTIRPFKEQNYYAKCNEVIKMEWCPLEEAKRLCEADFFILDDILAEFAEKPNKEITEQRTRILVQTIDDRWNNSKNKATFLTTNLWEKELKNLLPPSVISRLKDANFCKFFEVTGEDKRAILN